MISVAYFSNFLNHHQKPVADELYTLLGADFTFVETVPMCEWLKEGGYTDFSNEKYVIRAWETEESSLKAVELAKNVDVALFGGPEVLYLEVIRAKSGNKLSFDVSERWLKRGVINILSFRLLKFLCYYHLLFRWRRFYKLCASSFAARDQDRLLSFKGRCYKWGYFTRVDGLNGEMIDHSGLSSDRTVRIMWCSRFLKLKHPELPVKLAARLKKKGYRFVIDMFGSGTEQVSTKLLAGKLDVNDVVNFCGNRSNNEILAEMRAHDIFLFTSDKREGWGAVLNEAMASGCAVVASDQIGSVPFLIDDMTNGCIFKSKDLDSLEEKVEYLLDNPVERRIMAYNGYLTLKHVWSPENAAHNLMILIDDLTNGRDTSIAEGPCSKALPI